MNQVLLRLDAVKLKTGLSRSLIYQLMASNKFPHQIKISKRCSGWLQQEVDTWIEDRIQDRNDNKKTT